MRTLHQTLMGLTLVGLLCAGAGFLIPGGATATAQHGHPAQPEAQAHFDAMVEQLELSDDQRAAIAPLFGRGYTLMLELHEIHASMAAEMNEEQRERFAQMVHDMLGGPIAPPHGEAGPHPAHDDLHREAPHTDGLH